jgi:hypothetical protein
MFIRIDRMPIINIYCCRSILIHVYLCLLNFSLQAKEKSCDIDFDNYTSEVETTPSPRQCYSTKLNCSHNSLEKVQSHQTLYELVDQGKPKSNGKSSTSNYQLRPINTVQFNQSQISIAESGLSGSRFKIHSQQNRIPIRISSLKRETKTAQTLSMVC